MKIEERKSRFGCEWEKRIGEGNDVANMYQFSTWFVINITWSFLMSSLRHVTFKMLMLCVLWRHPFLLR